MIRLLVFVLFVRVLWSSVLKVVLLFIGVLEVDVKWVNSLI